MTFGKSSGIFGNLREKIAENAKHSKSRVANDARMLKQKTRWVLTRVKPTQVKTKRHVHRFASTIRVIINTARRASPMFRNSSCEIT